MKTLYELIMEYRVFLRGRMQDKKKWVEFYRRNQKFQTICNNCKLVEDVKKYLKANKELKQSNTKKNFSSLDTKMGEGQRLYKEIFKEQIAPQTKSLLYKWLIISKANLLHRKGKNKAQIDSTLGGIFGNMMKNNKGFKNILKGVTLKKGSKNHMLAQQSKQMEMAEFSSSYESDN